MCLVIFFTERFDAMVLVLGLLLSRAWYPPTLLLSFSLAQIAHLKLVLSFGVGECLLVKSLESSSLLKNTCLMFN